MSALFNPSAPELAYDVLRFMRENVQHKAMLADLLDSDLERWFSMSLEEQRAVFERQRRRFEMACPSLAKEALVRKATKELVAAVPVVKFRMPRYS